MVFFTKIVQRLEPLTAFTKKLLHRLLIWFGYVSGVLQLKDQIVLLLELVAGGGCYDYC